MTTSAAEIDALDGGRLAGWARTGQSFNAYGDNAAKSDAAAVCRYYGLPERGLDTHFFSADAAECAAVGERFAADWVLETSAAFRIGGAGPEGACAAGIKPVYRLFNNRHDANHRYTTSAAIRDDMVARGFALEGNGPGFATMCALPD
jgi:hypothetical protein